MDDNKLELFKGISVDYGRTFENELLKITNCKGYLSVLSYIEYDGTLKIITPVPTPSPIQTKTFTDSKCFTNSKSFSTSKSFSRSQPFTNSKSFSVSEAFSSSLDFSYSSKFHGFNSIFRLSTVHLFMPI